MWLMKIVVQCGDIIKVESSVFSPHDPVFFFFPFSFTQLGQ